jgi:transcription antitermination factor NusG
MSSRVETEISPSQAAVLPAPPYPWFALMVRLSQANAASQALRRLGFELFWPTQPVRRQWSDRVKLIEEPLFPGYLFCRFDPQYRLPILTAPGVISIVGFGKTLSPVDDEEIDTIRRLWESRLQVCPHPYLRVGQGVRIERGALAGVEGILVEARNEYRMVVSITILQRSVAVEIDPIQLKRL